MNEKSTEQAMEKLYTNLYNVLCPIESDPKTASSYLSMMKSGIAVTDDFAGDISQACILANAIPPVSKSYTTTGKLVSDAYKRILGADVPDDEPSASEKERYKEAKTLIGSDAYKTYKDALKLYKKASRAYYSEKNKTPLNKQKLRKTKDEMDSCFDDLVAADKNNIENALSTIAAYEYGIPSTIFSQAVRSFQAVSMTAESDGYYDVVFFPGNWQTNLDKLAWSDIVIKSTTSAVKIHTESQQTASSFSRDYSGGFWFWKHADRATSSMTEAINKANSSSSSETLSMSMQLAIVELERTWLNLSLLNFSQAILKHEEAGCITNGTLINAEGCLMPLLPSAFVLVKDVTIYNSFTSEEAKLIEIARTENSAELSYGPFRSTKNKSASFNSNLSDKEKKEFGSVSKVTFGEEPQIIGILSSVVKPKFPKNRG